MFIFSIKTPTPIMLGASHHLLLDLVVKSKEFGSLIMVSLCMDFMTENSMLVYKLCKWSTKFSFQFNEQVIFSECELPFVSSRLLYAIASLSVVCNVRAPYSAG